jgi:hypothetical protein
MSRLRTHNNRRRARELKQGGLYTLRYRQFGVTWSESDASPIAVLGEIRCAWFGLS